MSGTHSSPGAGCSCCGAPGGRGEAGSSPSGHQPAAPSSAYEPRRHSGLRGEACDGGAGLDMEEMEAKRRVK